MLLVDARHKRVIEIPVLSTGVVLAVGVAVGITGTQAALPIVVTVVLLGVFSATEFRLIVRADESIIVRSLLLSAKIPADQCWLQIRRRGPWKTRLDLELGARKGWPLRVASYPPMGSRAAQKAAHRVARALEIVLRPRQRPRAVDGNNENE